MKLLIITADKSQPKWKSLAKKHKIIKSELDQTGYDWEVVSEYRDYIPIVQAGRITHAWFDDVRQRTKGADVIAFHFSEAQRKEWGIQPSLRGANHIDKDYTGEVYFWADENTKRGRYNQYIETLLHEVRHEFKRIEKKPDDTHYLHDKYGTIRGQFNIDISNYTKKKSLYVQLVELLKKTKISTPSTGGLLPLVKRQAQNVIDEMALLGHRVRITEGYRTFERQGELYAQGRTKPGPIVTNAKPGESLHNYGVAIDFVFVKEGYNASKELWETLGKTGEKQGFRWGGRWQGFVDRPHFELTFNYSLKAFQQGKVDKKRYI